MTTSTLNLPTITLHPTPPTSPTGTPGDDPGTKIVLLAPSLNSWSTWTPAEQDGVIVAGVLAILLLLSVVVWLYLLNKKRRRKIKELERGPDPNRSDRRASIGSVVKGKMRASSRSDSRLRKVRSTSKPRGIEGLDSIEVGPAASIALSNWHESGASGAVNIESSRRDDGRQSR